MPGYISMTYLKISSVQLLQLFSRLRLFTTPWILHYLSESAWTHVHWVGDALQPSHPPSSPSVLVQSFPESGSFQMSQFCTSGGQSIGVSASASVLPMNIQEWLFRMDWLYLLPGQGTLKSLSPTQFKSINSQHSAFFIVQLSKQLSLHFTYLRI